MALMKFIRSSFRVEVDPKSLMLAPLLDIWNNDQSVTKDYANKLLTYVHIVSRIDPDAPFYNSDPGEVPFLAKSQIYRNIEHQFTQEEELLIDQAIEVYIKANEIVDERLLKTYSDKLDQMRLELGLKKFEIVRNKNGLTGVVTFASNSKIITDSMKDIDKILDVRDALQERLDNAKSSKARYKADRKPSFLETQLAKVQNDAREREAAAAAESEQSEETLREDIEEATSAQDSNGGHEQQDVQDNGTKSQQEKRGNIKAFLPAGRSEKGKPKKKKASSGVDEEF